MAINKTIMGSVTAGVVVITAAVSGAILAANTSPSDSVTTPKIEQNIKLNGWQQKNNDWYYYKDDVAKTGWIQDNNVWYYLDDSGKMKLNWIQDKDKWYYLGSDGKMRTGWIQDQGNWYYINTYGIMATNITIDGYYLNENGIMTDTPAQKSKQIEKESSYKEEANNPIIIRYSISDSGYIMNTNYPNESSIQLKLGQTIKLIGKVSPSSSERVLFDSTVMSLVGSGEIKAIAIGGGNLTIIPNRYDWDKAYKYHIIVNN